jgi:hypothetical protein
MKVTDKRMFTPEGELREEFRHLTEAESTPAEAPSQEPTQAPSHPSAEQTPPPAGSPRPGGSEPGEPASRVEMPATPPEMGGPSFLDLVGLVAEPVAIYLGEVELPDGRSAENLEAARFHIDLLDVLRQKTAGSLTAHEAAVLDDLLYRLRLRYVQKRG